MPTVESRRRRVESRKSAVSSKPDPFPELTESPLVRQLREFRERAAKVLDAAADDDHLLDLITLGGVAAAAKRLGQQGWLRDYLHHRRVCVSPFWL